MLTMRASLLDLWNFENLEWENCDILTSLRFHWNDPQTLSKFIFCEHFRGKLQLLNQYLLTRLMYFPTTFLPIIFPGQNNSPYCFFQVKKIFQKFFSCFFLLNMSLVHSGKTEFSGQRVKKLEKLISTGEILLRILSIYSLLQITASV